MNTTKLIAAAVAATFVLSTGGAAFAAMSKGAAATECSKQADAKNLHGKERKKFRETCKRDMMQGGMKQR
ncbi:MAG TPA: PsiF family protein [Rhizobiaceae bacterium]